ncbi:Zinc finger, CCHC domain-containing protein [Dissophora ornata]|nr:Zinc finger, CCHC domain-containing protein [Dissophora ornata]
MVNREHYIDVLLQCIMFEFATQVNCDETYELPVGVLVQSFNALAEFSCDDDYCLSIPCDIYIGRCGLDGREGVIELLEEFNNDVESEYYQLFTYGCDYTVGYYGNEYFQIPGLSDREIQDFLWSYAKDVPADYQDDIATVINFLRDEVWENNGSGGILTLLTDRYDVEAVRKYTREHNNDKVTRSREREQAVQEGTRKKQEQDNQLRQEEERQQADRRRRDKLNANMDKLRAVRMSTQQRDIQAADVANTINNLISQWFPDSYLTVHLVGSFANGLSADTSDVDMTVIDDDNCLTITYLVKVLRELGYRDVIAIPNAKVPVATFTDPRRNFSCDISINEPLGIENSKLIWTYQSIDSRVQTIWFTLKQIAKKYDILSAKRGFLSSYALTMMLITYLQSTETPVLPCLQQQPARRMVQKGVDGVNCTYDRNWSNHQAAARLNTSTAAELLLGFLSFFGNTFDYGLWEVNPRLGQIRTRPAVIKVHEQRGNVNSEYMCVMDPFLVNRNVAGMVRGPNVATIKGAFREAHLFLMAGNWHLSTN